MLGVSALLAVVGFVVHADMMLRSIFATQTSREGYLRMALRTLYFSNCRPR